MSADSAHQKRAPSTSETVRLVPNIVPPQAVSDRSIIDSVAGFINDVALTNVPQTNPRDHILWVKFENLADISDTCLGEDCDVEGNLPPPLLLCIGYGSGVQVWAVPANGEAIEVMSWKNGSVNIMRILPTPFLSSNSELANDLLDQFIHKRPLMALCGDCPVPTSNQPAPSQNQLLHAINFVSLKDGDVVKTIRFKTPIVDIVANRTSIAITFHERIAIFDARTLEDRLTVTTCYPCPNGLCPIALGDRWIAYAERKLIPSKASAGGCFIDGIPSYTATVLNAAKSLGKGLRELGEQVAAGLTGGNPSTHPNNASSSLSATNIDGTQPGVVTILDIKHPIKDISPTSGTPVAVNGNDPIIAHFLAHTEAVIAMSFDPSGMILITADRRGHDFNVFRIQSHPCGSVLAAVHHLYVLHRGDTTAKVQDISFSFDSRWVAVSTLRGTTHVFPITPYGGHCGYRTHSAPHVVNRLSRFHRSAGLPVDGRSSSPILMSEHAVQSTAYANPRLPPFPHPTVVLPLTQLRQPSSLSSTSSLMSQTSSTQLGSKGNSGTGRQRHHSTEESHSKPLRVAAIFAKARSWLLDPPGLHETPSRLHRRAVDSLFVIAGHGALIQYDLEPRHASNVPKERVCDETPIELEVEAKAQWILGQKSSQMEISPPLPADNWLIKDRVIDNNLNLDTSQMMRADERDDRWLSQVEIVTHAGPHRRLWMGPQFVFKLYNTPTGNSLAHIDVEAVEVGAARAKSTPVNMPSISNTTTATRPLVPVLIESGSCSSHEQSPRLLDSFHYESTDSEIVSGPAVQDSQLKEDLADAMRDCAPVAIQRESASSIQTPQEVKISDVDSLINDGASSHTVVVSIVNPRGTVTTVTNNNISMEFVETFSNDNYILENCDETMFRPVITVTNNPNQPCEPMNIEECSQPIEMPLELIVPVIDERVLEEKKRQREIEQQERARLQKEAEKIVLEEEKKKIEKAQTKKLQDDAKMNMQKEPKDDKTPAEPKTNEPVAQTRKGKRAQKYTNKKWADIDKKGETKKETPKIAEDKPIVKEDVKEDETLEKEPIQDAQTDTEMIENIQQEKEQIEYEKIQHKEEIIEEEINIKTDEMKNAREEEKHQEPEQLKVLDSEPLKETEDFNTLLIEETSLKTEEKSFPDKKESFHAKEISFTESSLPPNTASEISEKSSELSVAKFVKKETVEVQQNVKKNESGNQDWKKNKKGKNKLSKALEKQTTKPEEKKVDFPPLDDHSEIDKLAIMKISMHETIGDEEIQIIPHESTLEIHESPEKSGSDVEIIDENFILPSEPAKTSESLIKNDDFYDIDIDEDLPPLEPFDPQFEGFGEMSVEKNSFGNESHAQKDEIIKKMSEFMNDTNIVFAMCSSLKDMKEDDESKSMSSSSHIQRSTSSSLTTNTTTATFASASSNQIGEGHDSDYKSLDLEIEEIVHATADIDNEIAPMEFKIPSIIKAATIDKEDAEDISSFEATSSETDDSSKKSNIETKFKREDDEELRPLLETSTTSLTLPGLSGTNTTTEANVTPTLPELNQKSQVTSNSGSGKRKNKKKRR